jgi:hypothetical protein
MFIFQLAQKPLEQQRFSVKVYTGNEAQRIMQQVSTVSEQMLTAVHKTRKPDAF